MELKDLLLEKAAFTLSSNPDKIYKLRPPNLEDRAVMEKKFGYQGVQKVLLTQDWNGICFIFMQLIEDKSDFAAFDEEILDAEGEKVKVRITATKILQRKVLTAKDRVGMLQALATAFVNSDEDVKKVVDDELKKKTLTSPQSDSTTSSTSSQASTDGPMMSSGN